MLNRCQLGLLCLLLFIAVALFAWLDWLYYNPTSETKGLVAPRQRISSSLERLFIRPDFAKAKSDLEKSLLWGVKRDGSPIIPPVAVAIETNEQKNQRTAWQLIATVVRPNERYILIKKGNEAAITVREGQKLPDDNTLELITPQAIWLRTPEKKSKSIAVYQE